jgi:hypothetical protein
VGVTVGVGLSSIVGDGETVAVGEGEAVTAGVGDVDSETLALVPHPQNNITNTDNASKLFFICFVFLSSGRSIVITKDNEYIDTYPSVLFI